MTAPGPAPVPSGPPRNLLSRMHRPDLVRRVLDGLEGQLVLVRAPAGFGKTETLAAAYGVLEGRGECCLWVTLPPAPTAEDIAQRLAAALDLPLDRAGPGAVLAALAARRAPLYLFLDMAERLTGRTEAVAWLLDQTPDALRMAIAGRGLPDMRLSRLRMRGLLAELGHDVLVFGRGEMARMLGQHLSPQELDQTVETLAGWPALVRLAALVMEQGADDAGRRALTEGRHPVLRDFLLDEVLPGLSDGELGLLRACLGLGAFTPEIAADLAGHGRMAGGAVPRMMEALAPLVLSDPQAPGWFRLHPAVAQLLPLLGPPESPAACRARHIRAATLFADRGMLEKSVLHASLGGDHALAVRMIEAAGGVNLFLRAGYTVLRDMVRSVPSDVVRTTPSLRLCRGVMLAKSGDIRAAREVIDALAADTMAGLISADPSWMATLEYVSRLNDIYEDRRLDGEGLDWLKRQAEQEREENIWRLGWLCNHLTIAQTRLGNLEAARHNARRALSFYREERCPYPQAFMAIHLAFVNLRANRLDAATAYCRQAETLIQGRQWNDANLLAIAHVPLAAIRYAQGDVAMAGQMLDRAMPTMARGEGWVDFFALGYTVLARARLYLSGWPAAEAALRDGLTVAEHRDLPRLRLELTLVRAELMTWAGKTDAAEAVLRDLPDTATGSPWPTARARRRAMLCHARLRLRRNDPAGAAAMLDALVAACRVEGDEDIALAAHLLRCEAAQRGARHDEALESLRVAASLSASGRQRQQFHDEGPALAQAVRSLVRRTGVSRLDRASMDYLARVIALAPRGRDDAILSPREADVLRFLDKGLTNKAIAREIGLSEPTVKFHLKNLYGKLGVSRRVLAVQVARTNRLLAD